MDENVKMVLELATWGALEKCMIRFLPGIDLKAIPHINSKIHVWKNDHDSLQTMMSNSGFGWNDAAKMIQVDSDDVWEQYVKTDSNARSMRYKPYPFYHHWLEIFGKDRATGEHTEDFSTTGNGESAGEHNAQEQNVAAEEEVDGSKNNSVENMDVSQHADSATSKKTT